MATKKAAKAPVRPSCEVFTSKRALDVNPFLARLRTEYEWIKPREPLSQEDSSLEVAAAEELLRDYLISPGAYANDDFEDYTKFLLDRSLFDMESNDAEGMMLFALELIAEVRKRECNAT